ncbi:MAG: sulfite exporter TauE/SafE family protein [Clostridia bacterium]|nr:sulfite exporter TauE/SafE family protein [Clostridia bacterium]
MKNINMENKTAKGIYGWKKWVIIAILSLLAGCINGFVGTGGGIVIVYMLLFLDSGGGDSTKNAFAKTLVAVIPMSFVAFLVYLNNGNVDTELMGRVFIPATLGGIVGACLMYKIDKKWLTMIFSSLVIYSGVTLITRAL